MVSYSVITRSMIGLSAWKLVKDGRQDAGVPNVKIS